MSDPPDSAPWTPPWPRWLNLSWLSWIEPWARLVTRLVVGAYLVWNVWSALITPGAIWALAGAQSAQGVLWSELAVRIAVYVQMACGLAFIAGLLTRWAGLVCAIMFTITAVFALRSDGLDAAIPAVLLALIGLDMLARGPGPFNLRALLVGR